MIWIQRLPHMSPTAGINAIYSIGKGIIGSSDEEKSRKCLTDWNAGTVVLVPSNGGKAVGWIYDKTKNGTADSNETSVSSEQMASAGHAEFIMAKIPVDMLASRNDSSHDEQPQWVTTLQKYCQEGLQAMASTNQQSSDIQEEKPVPYFQFPPQKGKMIITALQAAKEGKNNNEDAPTTIKAIPIPTPVSETTTVATCPMKPKEKCVPCEGLDKTALLSLDEAKLELAAMTQPCVWSISSTSSLKEGVLIVHREFVAKNFQAALDSINAMGEIAEREGHHPNFHLINYREVKVDIYTHSLGGLTKNDFVLAERLSTEVNIDYSPKWLRENPNAQCKH
jgi:4a-hydroxytetrahydrobiopterin dehydratase